MEAWKCGKRGKVVEEKKACTSAESGRWSRLLSVHQELLRKRIADYPNVSIAESVPVAAPDPALASLPPSLLAPWAEASFLGSSAFDV